MMMVGEGVLMFIIHPEFLSFVLYIECHWERHTLATYVALNYFPILCLYYIPAPPGVTLPWRRSLAGLMILGVMLSGAVCP